jgi:anthranilate phosphoribosyltransferase
VAPGDPKYNAKTIREIFKGEERGPKRDVVVLNAAGAFVVGGKVQKLKEGVAYAQKVIDDGRALKKLDELVRVSQQMKEKD